jgi:glutathione S-transferase
VLKLYYAADTCSLATHIALEEAGADYSTVKVDFAKAQQRSPEYLKLNPKARVPALVTDRGVLTETPAMLAFVAQSFPAARLAPLDDPFAFAEVQAFNSYLCSSLHVAHAHRMRGSRWVDADDAASIAAMQRKVPQSVSACYELIERDMLEGPWVMGERYTICDPYLFTLAQWLEEDGVDPARIPRVIDHRRRVSERAAVRKAIDEESATGEQSTWPR